MDALRASAAAKWTAIGLFGWSLVWAQQLPFEPAHNFGQSITGAFEGWFPNSDGSFSILLGYYNRNLKQELEIPAGADNRIEPGGPDQGQPTHFLGGRQWGVFTIRVPKDFGDRKLTWTLTANGKTTTIPLSLNPLWELEPLREASGNAPPFIGFSKNGPWVQGPAGQTNSVSVTWPEPVDLAVWVADDAAVPLAGPRPRTPAATVSWSKFRGPGTVTFANPRPAVEKADFMAPPSTKFMGTAHTSATFAEPGDYILRVVANDWSGEGGRGFQCCWSNAQVKVSVRPLPAHAAATDGEGLYKQRCATCHDGKPQPRMPSRQELSARTPESVYQAMFGGMMESQSSGLSNDEGRAIARFVASKEFGTGGNFFAGKCSAAPGAVTLSDRDWNGWSADLGNSRHQPKPGLSVADVRNLKLKWAFAFQGDTVRSAQPAIVGGRLFIGSASGAIYSLDAITGCMLWKYEAGATVRTAISIGKAGGRTIAYFGDVRANVFGLDAASGQLLWKVSVEDHPAARITGAPVFYDGRLYVPVSSVEEVSAMSPMYECCKFRGSLVALDGATGKQVWKTFSVPDPARPYQKSATGTQQWGPAGAAIWSAPTIDVHKKVIYAATGNSYTNVSTTTSDAILAFDLETGSLLWSSQVLPKDNFTMGCMRGVNCPEDRGPDFDFGSSPILRELPGGKRVLVCGQKSGVVWGLDPDQHGKVLWQTRLGQGSALGGIEWGPTADLDNAYVAISDVINPQGRAGGLHAVKLSTGEKIWTTPPPDLSCTPGAKGCNSAQSAAISSIPGVIFSGSIDGHLRAFLSKTGEIVWDFNTARDYETVNGVPGKGGSLDSAGPVIVDGMVFTNSGYGMWQGLPGNVLLAFAK